MGDLNLRVKCAGILAPCINPYLVGLCVTTGMSRFSALLPLQSPYKIGAYDSGKVRMDCWLVEMNY